MGPKIKIAKNNAKTRTQSDPGIRRKFRVTVFLGPIVVGSMLKPPSPNIGLIYSAQA
jgi:hypothetical protein